MIELLGTSGCETRAWWEDLLGVPDAGPNRAVSRLRGCGDASPAPPHPDVQSPETIPAENGTLNEAAETTKIAYGDVLGESGHFKKWVDKRKPVADDVEVIEIDL